MVPVLSLGPLTVATHDAFSVLALGVGLVIYYVELRRRGWLEPIVWISSPRPRRRHRRAADHRLGASRGLRGVRRCAAHRAIEHSGKSIIGALAGGYLATVVAKRAFGYTRSTGDAYLLAIPVAPSSGGSAATSRSCRWAPRRICRGGSRSRPSGRGLCPLPRL